MRRSLLAGSAAVPVALVALGAPALAHVTVDPDTAPGGGYTTVAFRVPTESDTASTTQVQVYLPTDHPFGSVSVRPVTGWRYRVVEQKLTTPITTDDGQVSQAVSQIAWTATSRATAIKPGEFQDFSVSLGPLPDSGSVVFKVLQTHSDGEVARWIQPAVEGQAEPEHPAPTLTLTPAGESSTEAAVDAGSSGNGRSDWALGLSGLAVVIAAGGAALGLRRKGS
ncbi:MAG TPA: YcnI family protein [Nocardioides sp.]|nr:YcnI family protein [Nocardioides sp.]